MKSPNAASDTRRGRLLIILLVLGLVSAGGGAGFWYQRSLRHQAEEQAHNNLRLILEGRTAEIANWVRERRGDGQQVMALPLLQHYLQDPENLSLRRDVRSWMEAMRRSYDYAAIILLADDLSPLVETPVGTHLSHVHFSRLDASALFGRDVFITDLHRSVVGETLHFTVVAPLGGQETADRSARGLMLMVMDPESFIFPVLRRWPVISDSSEILLVQRVGDEVVYLNNLRHEPDTALNLRLPLAQTDLPSAQSFVRNGATLITGKDYRGIPVVAAIGPVPGTPWHMVVKTDEEEIWVDFKRTQRQIILLILLAVVVLVLGGFLAMRKWRTYRLQVELRQRRDSETAARHAAMRMRLATEATGLGIWEWEVSRGRMYWDAQMFRIYGLPPSHDHVISYENWRATVVPGDLPRREAALKRSREGEPGPPVEFRIIKADTGELRHLVATETSQISEPGLEAWIVGTTLDITERKAADQALQESMARLRLATAVAGVGIWEWNVKTNEVRWDKRIAEIYGFEAAPENAPTMEERLRFVVPEDRAEQARILQHTVATKGQSRREFRIRRGNDQSLRIIQAADTVRLDEKGEVEWLVGSNLDITEQRHAEDQIQRLSTVAEQSPLSIVITDLDGNIEYTNPYFSALTGYSAAEIKGKNPRILQSGKTTDEQYEELWQTITAGRTWRGRLHNRKKTGEPYWEEALICPLRNGRDEISGYLAVKSDATARIQSEREIKELNQSLEKRVKRRTHELELVVQELESFSYSVSHDLRAPLRAIDGWAQVLLEDFGGTLPEDGVNALNRLRAAAQRMGTLIEDLLRLSRVNRQKIDFTPVAMEALVQEVVAELRASQPDAKPVVTVAPLPDAQGASSLLRQVWANLIGNAFKFSAKAETPTITVGSRTSKDGVTVYYVKDNGAGFNMRFAHKLFGAFQRLHSPRDFPGTGIGLALSQRIVRRHGGRIWAEGEVGKGAEFCFTLSSTDFLLPPTLEPKESNED